MTVSPLFSIILSFFHIFFFPGIMIDLTNGSPYPLRFNGFTPINRQGLQNSHEASQKLPQMTFDDLGESSSSSSDDEYFNDSEDSDIDLL